MAGGDPGVAGDYGTVPLCGVGALVQEAQRDTGRLGRWQRRNSRRDPSQEAQERHVLTRRALASLSEKVLLESTSQVLDAVHVV